MNHISSERRRDDNLEYSMHSIMLRLQTIWYQSMSFTDELLKDSGFYDSLDRLARKSAKHPYAAFFICVCCLAFAVPILIFVIFALSTLFMAFTGFLFIGGTLTTAISVLLLGCLGAVLLILIFFGSITVTGYIGFMHIYDLFHGIHNKTALTNFLNQEKSKSN